MFRYKFIHFTLCTVQHSNLYFANTKMFVLKSGSSCPLPSSGYLKAKQYMEEENYDKIISECTKEVESGGRYTAEALLLRATFYLLIGNATAAQPDLDKVINMPSANVKVRCATGPVVWKHHCRGRCFSAMGLWCDVKYDLKIPF